jgi:adenylate cyclase
MELELVGPEFPRKPLVLVVDDTPANRDVLSMYFITAGAEVLTASDGAKAIQVATQSLPDLVLLDVQMPHMDGFEACKRLKAHPATQFVPVVIVTALDSEEDKIKAIESGADDFLTKPYSLIVLMTRARALLKIKHLTDQLRARNRLLRRVLNRYVAEEVADTILTDPEKHLQLGGETREVTVLFADIRGFTTFTEQHPAERVLETLNHIFSQLTPLVFKHRGTFDKYLGDAILAFYGAPLAGPDDALRATQSALEMQDVFERLRREAPDTIGRLGLGIGLHSGEATVGNVGSETVMDYTVIGDTVNVARRLQEDARSSEILMSEATWQQVQDQVTAERLGPHPIHGRTEAVMVYSLRPRPAS